ncbi:RimJ/RimL family protein N-acetyltransferase [Sphingomonas sp. SORGH_AS 950]|uniref:GNAT family N-acetyltransferase n=1 Tax=Sphingomonas sp. SORGH_AS_0950 TaxID=3041792 RepID=UPI002786EC12|nr:GNAT family protein [Sphingomonas sp. SORGH_AS_0950]MDQ1159625.1 RimJ/RimL family protein N-acetyltransferase [Sphingomonas sp. SORGH_AS_0950]
MPSDFTGWPFPRPKVLDGATLTLEPLEPSHRNQLREAAAIDPSIWTYFPKQFNGAGDNFDPWFDASLRRSEAAEHYPFAVRRKADAKIIGTTRYYDMAAIHRRLAIGSTWYVPEARGSLVNFEVRLLTLMHAFEVWSVNRVELITDPRNLSSRAAMKLLGAKQEGIIRNHLIYEDGRVRDSILFSIVCNEWINVRQRLVNRLDGYPPIAKPFRPKGSGVRE